MKCPICSKDASTPHHLKKHLAGTEKYGGHGLPEMRAEAMAQDVFAGSYRPMALIPQPPTSPPLRPTKALADPYAGFLADLFNALVINKQLPKYQFERRVDAIIAMFLPGIFKQWRGWNVEFVVPEFPLKKLGNNQSTNADSLWFRHAEGTTITEAWIFFELKTDSASCNDEQLSIYRSAMDRGMPKVLDDLKSIASASSSRAKYQALQRRLEHLPADRPIELVYLSPSRIDCEDHRVMPLSFRELEKMSVADYPLVWELFRSIVLPHLGE